MPGHDIIAIGASAGGVEALTQLVKGLPADLPAAVFMVLHVPAHGTSVMPQILSRNGPLPAAHARDGEPIQPGRIYIAPPDNHLLIHDGKVRLSRGPRENGHRPAVDPLFRSAARWYGRRVVGVILSGALDDGTAGLTAVKQRGGVAIAQDPDDAFYPSMPRSALENVAVDHALPLAQIPATLVRLAHAPVVPGGEETVPDDMELEAELSELGLDVLQGDKHPGTPSGFACPDCGGALWELRDGELIRFRCRVGHAWSVTSLLSEQAEALESALWTALRALEERAALAQRLCDRLRERGHERPALRFEEEAREAHRRAAVIRQVLLTEPKVNAELPPDPDAPAP